MDFVLIKGHPSVIIPYTKQTFGKPPANEELFQMHSANSGMNIFLFSALENTGKEPR